MVFLRPGWCLRGGFPSRSLGRGGSDQALQLAGEHVVHDDHVDERVLKALPALEAVGVALRLGKRRRVVRVLGEALADQPGDRVAPAITRRPDDEVDRHRTQGDRIHACPRT